MARAPTRFSNARYGLYGMTIGVFAGIPLGIWLNASSFRPASRAPDHGRLRIAIHQT